MLGNGVLLDKALGSFDHLKNQDGVTEVMINKPNEIIIERHNKMETHKLHFPLSDQITLANLIAGDSNQEINESKPIISTALATKERVEIVLPPCAESGHVIVGMRIPSKFRIGYYDYKKNGAFENIKQGKKVDNVLKEYYEKKDYFNFIKRAVETKLNIMNSGGTSTGKTTFTNALVELIDKEERIITLEDTREIVLPHKNKVHLLSSSGNQGTSNIGFKELLKSCLRLRPDRILQSELRGEEAYYYLKGINTGHPGSISTVHADNAQGALSSINMFILQAGLGWNMSQIDSYVKNVIDVVIQWQRKGNKRYISEVLWLPK